MLARSLGTAVAISAVMLMAIGTPAVAGGKTGLRLHDLRHAGVQR